MTVPHVYTLYPYTNSINNAINLNMFAINLSLISANSSSQFESCTHYDLSDPAVSN